MKRKSKKRRQSHGSAWHWKQTDCWYFSQPGTNKRLPLFDENGVRIRGIGWKVILPGNLQRLNALGSDQ